MDDSHARKATLILEILAVASIFFLLKALFARVNYSSQIAEIGSLVVITYLYRRRHITWRDVGLCAPKYRMQAVLYLILCVLSIALVFNFVIQPLFPEGANVISGGQPVTFSGMLFQLVVVGIGTAAIGEEMLMRGFVFNNLNDIFGRTISGTTAALLAQAALFAILHSGVQGIVSAGAIGLSLGFFYL
ncbi:MAG TPA: CPBP family glutamic-type intramembrane protease, partial [Puia sp.]|nr:CPBP family glutamic-type intramembrane protease [Puia sp.]